MANTVSVSAVPFNPNTQSFQSVSPAPQSQAVVNVNKGVPTAEQNLAAFQATQPKIPTTTNIPVSYVGTQGISVPTQQPPAPQAPILNTAQQIIEATKTEPTEIQKQGDALSMNIANLYSGLAGQGQYEGQKLEEFGYNKFKQQLNDLNTQILQKTAELNQDDVRLAASLTEIEKQAIPMNFITGQQQSVSRDAQIARALKASEIGVLNAVAIGTQGNIALAQEFATNAVAQKYAPIKEAIMIQEAQLKAIQPILTREEKKQAQEQQIKTTLALQEVEAKQKQAQNITSMIVGASQYAPASVITNAINLQKQGADEVTVARSLGEYGGDYLKNQLLKSQLVTEKAQQAKIYSSMSSGGSGSGYLAGGQSTAPISAAAQSWVTNINAGRATLANVPANLRNEVSAGLASSEFKTKIQASQAAYDLTEELKTLEGKGGAVGFGLKKTIFSKLPGIDETAIAGTDRVAYEAKFKQLQDTLASANLDKLKGAMSDKDIEFLRNVGTSLNLNMSESAFDAELTKIGDVMKSVPGVSTKKLPTTTPNSSYSPYADRVDTTMQAIMVKTLSMPSSSDEFSSYYNLLYGKQN